MKPSSTCERCHRPLRDPESVKAGMGPICRAKVAAEDARDDDQELIIPEGRGETVRPEDLPAGPGSKTYIGVRERSGAYVYVEVADGRRYPLRHLVYHSPTGMEWGYGGSGPGDTARSILADVAGLRVADALYMDFKWAFVAGFDESGFRLPEAEVLAWLRGQVRAA